MTSLETVLPSFGSILGAIAQAERRHGWLWLCEQEGQFLILSQELVLVLAKFLSRLEGGPVLEVCAGRGQLAHAVRSAGVHLVATDSDPPVGSCVIRARADEALYRYRPAVVLGCFCPIDAGVDPLVMGFPSVRHYVVLGARVGGLFGSARLWENPGWTAEPLEQVRPWMLTRHDVWMGTSRHTILQHGEAWHFRRRDS